MYKYNMTAAAPSLGLCNEMYAYTPRATSLGFAPDDGLVVANHNCAPTMSFLPPPVAVAPDDCFLPELDMHPPVYSSPPPVFPSENGMKMGFVGDGMTTTMMIGRATTGNGYRHRTPSSSRIGFRTRSEVDVLDDGFKWRKYGKKAVKSSPNPRNYYRCSAEGCGVKKRVERDRDDPRYVVTTYDGVHNHAAPSPQQATAAAVAPSDVWGMPQQTRAAPAASLRRLTTPPSRYTDQ